MEDGSGYGSVSFFFKWTDPDPATETGLDRDLTYKHLVLKQCSFNQYGTGIHKIVYKRLPCKSTNTATVNGMFKKEDPAMWIRNQDFDDQKLKKNIVENFFQFFLQALQFTYP